MFKYVALAAFNLQGAVGTSSWEVTSFGDMAIPADIQATIDGRNMYSTAKWEKASSNAMYTADSNWAAALATAQASFPAAPMPTPVTLPAAVPDWEVASFSDLAIPVDIQATIDGRNMYSTAKWEKASSNAMYTADSNWASALAEAQASFPAAPVATTWETPVTLPAPVPAWETPVTLPAPVPAWETPVTLPAPVPAWETPVTLPAAPMATMFPAPAPVASIYPSPVTFPAPASIYSVPAATLTSMYSPMVSTQPADVVTTASGLRFRESRPGYGKKPMLNDKVMVHYSGFLPGTGVQFDSTFMKGMPATVDVASLIPGLMEAVQLMEVGGKYEIVVPAHLAHGAAGKWSQIPHNQDLAFSYELIEVLPSAPASWETPVTLPAAVPAWETPVTLPAAVPDWTWEPAPSTTWEVTSFGDLAIPADIQATIDGRNMYSTAKWEKASSNAMYTADSNWAAALAKAEASFNPFAAAGSSIIY